MSEYLPDLAAIREAQKRIGPYIRRTPVLTSGRLDSLSGARLFFKCENFQKTGSFKARGAHNAIFSLSNLEASCGVITHSSGNHGAAIALAGRTRGIAARIVVPEDVNATKLSAIKGYGGEVVFCAPNLVSREATVEKLRNETGAVFIHPYENLRVIAGQGTTVLEFLDEIPDLDMVVAPIGGGGLMSGTCIAAKGVKDSVRLWGAEPSGAADASRSFNSGKLEGEPNPHTIADGLRASLGKIAFPILQNNLDGILTVSEESIVEATRLVWSTLKIVIEPSSAVVMAAVLGSPSHFQGQKVGVIFSGGNVDLDKLPWR